MDRVGRRHPNRKPSDPVFAVKICAPRRAFNPQEEPGGQDAVKLGIGNSLGHLKTQRRIEPAARLEPARLPHHLHSLQDGVVQDRSVEPARRPLRIEDRNLKLVLHPKEPVLGVRPHARAPGIAAD